MANNEPLYAILKALEMKMYRAVEGKRKHEEMVKYFDNIARYNQKQMSKTDIMIRTNKFNRIESFSLFWSGVTL